MEIENDSKNATDESALAPTPSQTSDKRYMVSGMYRDWFLDYASYVILERAVPYIEDGLKPVQRRILHSMNELEDGRYNKVANVVGNTMKYHPHGDASIGDALVQLGQKDLLIDCQGNWGNILTGDSAAAPRYIEARLSKFALDILFNPKTTDWKPSYDGRNREPQTLPVKFPLLLAQGVEGIAVGLSSKILPHNFNELLDAAISHLKGEEFQLFPDFQTGGYIDISRYNDGERGGSVKVRAKIDKIDNKTLVITEIPYGKTTTSIIESIIKAQEKGKIKIRKVDDNTSHSVEIRVHLQPGTSSDKTIDALYAFTDCEVSISPNCCVVCNQQPQFLNVSTLLKHNAEATKELLKRELEIKRAEISERLHFASLERIFIEERIYKDKEFEQSATMDIAVVHIHKRIMPFIKGAIREITPDDILRLMEIKMGRILKFNSIKAEEQIASYNAQIEEIDNNLSTLTDYTIAWFTRLKEKYGANFPRRTVTRGFDTIEVTKVVEANEKLYINRKEGFIGTSLKKDEYVCNCSDIDDIIVFFKDGKYKVVRVAEKMFVGTDILYVNVFKRNDLRTIYNVIYRNGRGGLCYIKRFAVTGVTRDKEYDITQGTQGTKIVWFSANPNGEAEVLKISFKPKPRMRSVSMIKDFSEIAIKGRASMGNIVAKNEISRIVLKERGESTLGGLNVWFDRDVLRLNYEGRGELLGEFLGTDSILVILKTGEYYISTFEATNHYETDILYIEKYNQDKVWSVVLFDADQGYNYLKRFKFDATPKKQSFIGDNPDTKLITITSQPNPKFEVVFGENDSFREPLVIDANNFIAVKSTKAKGKRITTFAVDSIEEIICDTPKDTSENNIADSDVNTDTQPQTPQVDNKSDNDESVNDEIKGDLSTLF